MTENEWVLLDTEEIEEKSRSRKIEGVEFDEMPSPYDIPEALRVYQNDKVLIIEFRYLTDEKTELHDTNQPGIFIRVGRNSKRLYAIEISLEALKESDIDFGDENVLSIARKAIGYLLDHNKTTARKSNYQMARRALHNQRNYIQKRKAFA